MIFWHAVESRDGAATLNTPLLTRLFFMKTKDFPSSIEGFVISGHQQARVLGMPTANIKPDDESCLAYPGIYAGFCRLASQTYSCLIYIGPATLLGITAVRLEVYLLNYSGDLYNQRVGVSIEHHIRTPRPFTDVSEAQTQLQDDLNQAKEYFKTHYV